MDQTLGDGLFQSSRIRLSTMVRSYSFMHFCQPSHLLTFLHLLLCMSGLDQFTGKSVHAVAEFLTPTEWIEIMQRVTGKKVTLGQQITRETFFTEEFHTAVGDEIWLKCVPLVPTIEILNFGLTG